MRLVEAFLGFFAESKERELRRLHAVRQLSAELRHLNLELLTLNRV